MMYNITFVRHISGHFSEQHVVGKTLGKSSFVTPKNTRKKNKRITVLLLHEVPLLEGMWGEKAQFHVVYDRQQMELSSSFTSQLLYSQGKSLRLLLNRVGPSTGYEFLMQRRSPWPNHYTDRAIPAPWKNNSPSTVHSSSVTIRGSWNCLRILIIAIL